MNKKRELVIPCFFQPLFLKLWWIGLKTYINNILVNSYFALVLSWFWETHMFITMSAQLLVNSIFYLFTETKKQKNKQTNKQVKQWDCCSSSTMITKFSKSQTPICIICQYIKISKAAQNRFQLRQERGRESILFVGFPFPGIMQHPYGCGLFYYSYVKP